MPVYLARFGALGPVKIGCSRSVHRRLGTIQAPLWDDLRLLRMLDGTGEDERALHARFAHLRIRGEWFTYSPEMLGDLGLPDLRADPARSMTQFRRRKGDPSEAERSAALSGWMVRRGLSEHDLASLLKCTTATIEDWLAFGSRPRQTITLRLIQLSEGELERVFGPRPKRAKYTRSAPAVREAMKIELAERAALKAA